MVEKCDNKIFGLISSALSELHDFYPYNERANSIRNKLKDAVKYAEDKCICSAPDNVVHINCPVHS